MLEPEIVQAIALPPELATGRREARDALPEASETVLRAVRQIIDSTGLHTKRVARENGLTISRIVILESAREPGEVTTRPISRRVNLSRGTVTSILDRLGENGLVERDRNIRGRRVFHTRLTGEGRATLRKAPALHETFRDRFGALTGRRQGRIVTDIQSVARMMDATERGAAPRLAAATVGEKAESRAG